MSEKSQEVNPTGDDPDWARARNSVHLPRMQKAVRALSDGAVYKSVPTIPKAVICLAYRDEIVRLLIDGPWPITADIRADVAKELLTAIDLIAPLTVWRPEPGERP
jgi:hypothetical protein